MKDQSKHVKVMDGRRELTLLILLLKERVTGQNANLSFGMFRYKYTNSWLLKTQILKVFHTVLISLLNLKLRGYTFHNPCGILNMLYALQYCAHAIESLG